jgi:single-strand DNA-binding protein
MSESMITLQGYVGSEPTLRTAGTHQVANFRVATTPRRLNRATGEWSDAPTQWFTVNAWRHLGVNVHQSVKKGDAVFVHGRLIARSWVNRDGIEVTGFEIEATVVGHDLTRGCSMMMRTPRRAERVEEIPEQWRAPGVDQAAEPATDPWAEPVASGDGEAAVPAA